MIEAVIHAVARQIVGFLLACFVVGLVAGAIIGVFLP